LFAPKISFNSICGGCGISMFSKPEKLGKLSNCPKSGNPAKTFSKDVGWRRMTGCDDSSPCCGRGEARAGEKRGKRRVRRTGWIVNIMVAAG